VYIKKVIHENPFFALNIIKIISQSGSSSSTNEIEKEMRAKTGFINTKSNLFKDGLHT
jgi:hypothetical protein